MHWPKHWTKVKWLKRLFTASTKTCLSSKTLHFNGVMEHVRKVYKKKTYKQFYNNTFERPLPTECTSTRYDYKKIWELKTIFNITIHCKKVSKWDNYLSSFITLSSFFECYLWSCFNLLFLISVWSSGSVGELGTFSVRQKSLRTNCFDIVRPWIKRSLT